MNFISWRARATLAMVTAAIWGAAVPPVIGGEKATISVPTKPTSSPDPASPHPPNTSFQPLDSGSSVGGFVDLSAAPGPVQPNVPDARTQKEMIERLDRKRNWLLDDGSKTGKSPGEFLFLDAATEPDYTTNPRRPQTMLERRLKYGAQSPTAETQDRNASAERPSSPGDDNLLKDSALDGWSGSQIRTGLDPSWVTATTPPLRGFQDPMTETPSSDHFRNSVSAAVGRNGSLDSLSLQRLERYQRATGGDSLTERTTSLGASVDHSRSRELRADVMGDILRAGSDPMATRAADPSLQGANGAPLARSQLPMTQTQGIVANPYAPPPAPPEPYVSPAAKMMRAAPQEIPRFRP